MRKIVMSDRIYVIGHVNPDTDSIASAMGYAWLLRERDGIDAIAARAGAVNPQTAWVLKTLGLDAPALLPDASPRFSSVAHRFDTTTPEAPLREAWAIANRTGGIAPVLNEDGTPFGILTGSSLFEFLEQLVGIHPHRQEMKVSEILTMPCREATDDHISVFPGSGRIRDSINRILREERDVFWVVDDKGGYSGICRQRDLLHPPRIKVIMVDHNEPHQALGAIEEAELIEIVDHHRLGNTSTRVPIRFSVDIVGSTSTLISERVEESGLSLPPALAGMLLAGLLSDTLIMTSPTTTDRDRQAAERISRWALAAKGPIAGETVQTFGEKLIASGAGLSTRTPEEVVNSDLKMYQSGHYQFAIAQAEVSDLVQVNEHLDALMEALNALRERRGLDFAMLMVTDIVRGTSRLLIAPQAETMNDLPYAPQTDGTWIAEGVVSRKKQLLPVVLGLLED
jgi:manganese-dependent inorganic pyrophosphatase